MNIRHALRAGAAAALVLSAPAMAVDEDFAAKAAALVEAAYPAGKPGAAVIVTEKGKVVYAGGSGMADIEKGVPITADTVFRLGSITKQFSAAAVLQLATEGKLSLDDPVSKFVPGYPEPGGRATVRQLLNHTSGIQSYTAIPGWMGSEKVSTPHTTAEMIAEFRDHPPEFQPGEKWDYNNSGYVLVGAVIEAVTGKPWHEVVRERFTAPLGLTTIRYGAEEAATRGFATGYSASDDGTFVKSRAIDMSVPHAAGALIGTVGDLARWSDALHHGKVVSAPLYAEMIALTPLPNGERAQYGYGIGQGTVRDLPMLSHGGGIFGFSTNSLYIPEKDVFVAVFTNSDSGITSSGLPMLQLAAAAIGKPFPVFTAVPFDPNTMTDWNGVYRIDGGDTTRTLFVRDGQLYTQRAGAGETKVWPAGDNRYFYGADSLNWFELVREADGTAAMLMHQGGDDKAERAVRTGPVPPTPESVVLPRALLESYAGSYSSMVAPIVVALGEDGALTLKFGSQGAKVLRPLHEAEFAAVGVDARVEFKREGGKVIGLVIHQGGRELPAERTGQ